jgi:thiol-disulfide isomerase/thioredoxin
VEVNKERLSGIVLIDFPKNGWCHLVADTIPLLHQFAEEIGLNRCWFENKRGKKKPHYDVKGDMIIRAIENGATQTSSKEIVNFLIEHYGNT